MKTRHRAGRGFGFLPTRSRMRGALLLVQCVGAAAFSAVPLAGGVGAALKLGVALPATGLPRVQGCPLQAGSPSHSHARVGATARAPRMASGTLSRQPGLHLFDTGQSESRAGQSVPVDAWGRPFTATSPPPLNHEERLDARARALFLLDFDHPLAKTSDVYRGVPGLYSAPGEHEAAGEAMRRRRGVCEEMVPTEFLAKWFKEKLEEVFSWPPQAS
ncbi:hypothetical protein T484DRAFT_2442993 [Baffinella frigidus]|nr:hypothetical protein T484DRAFT_2442993 [Cryptophyta sp. CCMP2293]